MSSQAMSWPLFALLFSVAAAVGAGLRFGFGHWIIGPWSTLLVNILGSLLIGFFYIYFNRFSPAYILVCVAFLGALTTYSSFALDMVKMIDKGSYGLMSLYFLLSNAGCLIGCYIGFSLAKKVLTTA